MRTDVNVLVADKVCVHAGRVPLLDAVDLMARPGEVCVILGPNGAGKSTLLSVLAGLRKPSRGQCLLHGREVSRWSAWQLALQRAVMLQDTAVAFDFNVQEVVELGRYPHRLEPVADEADIVSQAMLITDVAHLWHRRVNSLSGGERARVQLARVLAQLWQRRANGPSWLLLDEPTAALDLQHQHRVLDLVRKWARERGVGVLAVLHDLNLALRYADQVCVLDRGRLVSSGPPQRVLLPSLVASVWGVGVQKVRGANGHEQLLFGGPVPLVHRVGDFLQEGSPHERHARAA